jgi:hypothetical protein
MFAMGSAGAQAAEQRSYPSLAKRPAESSDRLAEQPAVPTQPAAPDSALVQTVQGLQALASTADSAFRMELGKARPTVSAAQGASAMSEPWVAAQMVISAADAARYESVTALASLDTLYVARRNGEDAARIEADMSTIDPVRAQVLSLVDSQNDTLDGLRKSLALP